MGLLFLFWPILLPIAAQVASTVVSGINNRKMLRYNSPKQQLARLRGAGLPFSAYEAGQAGNQSALPDISGIGGAGDTLSKYMGSRNDQVDFRVKENLADISDEDTKALFDNSYTMWGETDINPIRIKRKLEALSNIWELDNASNRTIIQGIEATFLGDNYRDGSMKKKWDAEIEKILLGNKLGWQLFNNTENAVAAKNKIIDTMQEGGLSFAESLLMVVMSAISGGITGDNVGNKGFQIGF